MGKKVILDVDPGIDDSLAILLALASPELEIEAITVVSGNCPATLGVANALSLLDLAAAPPILVAKGAEVPLRRPLRTAPEAHGPTGLGYAKLPPSQRPLCSQPATEVIINRVMAQPGQVTLVATGPLTNLALALGQQPKMAQAVPEVIIMGGALAVPGNTTPAAEFNFLVDPHAARIVLHSGLPITLVPLDVTERVILRPAHLAPLRQMPSSIPGFIADATRYYMEAHRRSLGEVAIGDSTGREGCFIHDALALALAFAPDLVSGRPLYVDVETEGELTMGQSVADFPGALGRAPNVRAALAVQTERFLELFLSRILSLCQKSSASTSPG